MPYHIKTLGAKIGTPGFNPPGLLRKVIITSNKYVHFMISNRKILPKNPSKPIFRETVIVATCPNRKRPKLVFLPFGQIGRYFQVEDGIFMQNLSF